MATILIVDDSSATRIQLRNLLEPHGHVCYEAIHGLDALEKLKKQQKKNRTTKARSPKKRKP